MGDISLKGRGIERKRFASGGTPAWQRKEGKSESGGLNRKGIASYRAANPGSKLSMAVTTKPSKLKKGSKAAKRRKSFCARMSGMKRRLTSEKLQETQIQELINHLESGIVNMGTTYDVPGMGVLKLSEVESNATKMSSTKIIQILNEDLPVQVIEILESELKKRGKKIGGIVKKKSSNISKTLPKKSKDI